MKIASDWFSKGLGKALGYLVGALVLGTAFPHLVKAASSNLSWSIVIIFTSILAASGGLLLWFLVPDGPNRKKGAQFEWNAIAQIFRYRAFRSAAFGYFGHMWELYTFWAFVPLILINYQATTDFTISISLWSFIIIAMGSLGCIVGGYISLNKGSAFVAWGMLVTSGICCLLSPFLGQLSFGLFLLFMVVWGFSVVGDSPQFSTLVAQTAPKAYIGTALTIVNSIGFALTIVSIQVISRLSSVVAYEYLFLLLLPGPLFGLWSMSSLKKKA